MRKPSTRANPITCVLAFAFVLCGCVRTEEKFDQILTPLLGQKLMAAEERLGPGKECVSLFDQQIPENAASVRCFGDDCEIAFGLTRRETLFSWSIFGSRWNCQRYVNRLAASK